MPSDLGLMFDGGLRQDVTCNVCQKVSTTFSTFVDLSLDIKNSTTIEDALSKFFQIKPIGDLREQSSLYKCSSCDLRVHATSQQILQKPPPVLCLHLKRFDHFGGNMGAGTFKIDKRIQLSKSLHLKKNGEKLTYDLRSSLGHIGTSQSCGHYHAYGEVSGRFFRFNDSAVTAVSEQEVLISSSYVVYYELRSTSWASLQNPSNDPLRPYTTGTETNQIPSLNPDQVDQNSLPEDLSFMNSDPMPSTDQPGAQKGNKTVRLLVTN